MTDTLDTKSHIPPNQQIGQAAEHWALNFLKNHGLTLIANNYRCRYGEIDLIMKDKNCLVFVEVRSRKHIQFGTGAETIDWRKQQKIINSAQHFIQTHHQYAQLHSRIDVISIINNGSVNAEFDWIQNAFAT